MEILKSSTSETIYNLHADHFRVEKLAELA